MSYDLVLSSGFLAFARHAGFLRAVEESGLPIAGVCGTSSGALTGALWAAGMPAETILEELTRRAPLGWVTWHGAVWRGAFRLDGVIDALRQWVPPRFEDLERPFGVGVATLEAAPRLLVQGPLPEAIAASCAVPWLFAPVAIDGTQYQDGAVVDRTSLAAWQAHRPGTSCVLHRIERTAGAAGDEDLRAVPVVHSPRSGASLWSLGDVQAAFEVSRVRSLTVFEALAR